MDIYVNLTKKGALLYYQELFSSSFSYATREAGYLNKDYLYLDHIEGNITKIFVRGVGKKILFWAYLLSLLFSFPLYKQMQQLCLVVWYWNQLIKSLQIQGNSLGL